LEFRAILQSMEATSMAKLMQLTRIVSDRTVSH